MSAFGVWLAIGFSLVSTLLVLFALGRRNERAVRRDWALVLSPRAERVYSRVEDRVQADLALADVTYDEAFASLKLGSLEDAMRLLDAGCRVILSFSPSMLRLLAAMATFSRMVSAMAPVRPLRPADFQIVEIRSLSYLNRVLHQMLVSTAERFRLRTYILGRCFGVATRYLLGATRRIVAGSNASEREWEQIQAIRNDFRSLTDESLESLRLLIASLDVEEREEILNRLR